MLSGTIHINPYSERLLYSDNGYYPKIYNAVSDIGLVPSILWEQKSQDVNAINYEKIAQFESVISGSTNANNVKNGDISKNSDSYSEFKGDNNKSVNRSSSDEELSDEEQKLVDKLKQIDNEVRVHEQAHLSASGGLARGGANFTYTQGPDGKQYATGGEVNIDTSIGETPTETINKMQRVIAAAMAPAEPSGQDHAVAASARQIIAQAQQQKNEELRAENQSTNNQNISNTETISDTKDTNNETQTNSDNTDSNNNIVSPKNITQKQSPIIVKKLDTYNLHNVNKFTRNNYDYVI